MRLGRVFLGLTRVCLALGDVRCGQSCVKFEGQFGREPLERSNVYR